MKGERLNFDQTGANEKCYRMKPYNILRESKFPKLQDNVNIFSQKPTIRKLYSRSQIKVPVYCLS